MNLVARLIDGATRGPEDTLAFREAFVGARASTGERVSIDRAMHLGPVFAAVQLRSRSVGKLPLKTYRRIPTGGRAEAWQEPVYALLHDEPNPEMSGVNLWSLVETHLSTWGNAYVGKEMTGGRVTALWPMYPERMEQVYREGGVKRFRYRRESGDLAEYTGADLLHFMGISLDGLTGMSPIGYAREAIAAGLAAEVFAGSFFENSAVPRGVIKVPGELDNEATERLAASWNAAHRGRKNMHKVAVLEGGAEFLPISMPLEDAQFVEQAKLSVQQVARILGVPPELIGGDSGGSLTYSTVEGQSLHFLTHGLSWDLALIEQTLARDRALFPAGPRAIYPEFLADAMLRTDMKTQAEVDAQALDPVKGWMSRAEVRARRNLPPENDRTPEALAAGARADMARVLAEISAARDHRTANGGAHALSN